MKNFLLCLWQLPQNLLGYILLLFYREDNSLVYKGIKVRISNKFPSGISLGQVIILKKYPTNKVLWADVKHEFGHHLQSVKWGWLYLFVIGLPSLIGNIYSRIALKNWSNKKYFEWYYNQPVEKDADRLGGVDRESIIELIK